MAGADHGPQPAGVALVDKPAGLTSFAVVKQVRSALGVRKAGHTGTLDPMATGVLPVCFGEATKIASLLLADDKAYSGSAVLGVQTDTLDITGRIEARADATAIDAAAVAAAMARQQGSIEQVPPAYSAIHSGGRRAHELARRGVEVILPPRPVVVHRIELCAFRPAGSSAESSCAGGDAVAGLPQLDFVVECGKGTYVRALVRDVGRLLGCGATLTALRRLRVGPFAVEACVPLAQLGAGGAGLLRMDEALARMYPAVDVNADDARRVRQGQPLAQQSAAAVVRIRCGGELVAIGEPRGGQIWPRRVFGPVVASFPADGG